MNLPNKITTFRMIAVIVIAAMLLFPYEDVGISLMMIEGINISIIQLIACCLFLIASFSDFVDGYLARKYNLVTTYGKFMDPIADKLLVNSLFIILTVIGPCKIPVIVTVIMIARDLLVDAIRQLGADKQVVIAANRWGKIKTVTQMVALTFVLLNNWPFALLNLPFNVTIVFCYIACAASLVSGVLYFIYNRKVFKD